MARLSSLAALTVLLGLIGPASRAQTQQMVPTDNWSYAAIEDLAAKGMVHGFPPTQNFFAGRQVTRFEMASLVARVAEGVTAEGQAGRTVPSDQADEVRRLIDEYRVELGVIGADMTGALSVLGGGPAPQPQPAPKPAAKPSGPKISGLIQTRAQFETDAPSRGVINSFYLRRSEIGITGDATKQVYYRAMIDPAKSLGLKTTSSGGNVTSVTVNSASDILQDLYVGYHLGHGFAVEIGQQKVPMSMEGMAGASTIPTLDEALFNEKLPVNNGRTGNIRDTGIMFRYAGGPSVAQLAIMNDAGNRQNAMDDNNGKEVMWHYQFVGVKGLTLGNYGEATGGVGANNDPRTRLGFEGQYLFGKAMVRGEYVWARDGAGAGRTLSEGGYLLGTYDINKRWQLVARGEGWNPNTDLHGSSAVQEYDLTLGGTLRVGTGSRIQFNYVRKSIAGPVMSSSSTSFLGLGRNVFLFGFEQAW